MAKKYISFGNKRVFVSGTSRALVIPATIVRANDLEAGGPVEVLWDGNREMKVRFPKKEVIE